MFYVARECEQLVLRYQYRNREVFPRFHLSLQNCHYFDNIVEDCFSRFRHWSHLKNVNVGPIVKKYKLSRISRNRTRTLTSEYLPTGIFPNTARCLRSLTLKKSILFEKYV